MAHLTRGQTRKRSHVSVFVFSVCGKSHALISQPGAAQQPAVDVGLGIQIICGVDVLIVDLLST